MATGKSIGDRNNLLTFIPYLEREKVHFQYRFDTEAPLVGPGDSHSYPLMEMLRMSRNVQYNPANSNGFVPSK